MAGIIPTSSKDWFYDSPEFSLATGQTDYDVKAQQAKAFNKIKVATDMSIRTDQDISIKFNRSSNDAISLSSSESPIHFDSLKVTNIFITNNSGNNANIKIFMIGRL